MSGVVALRTLVLAALRGDGGLMALVNAVEDGSTPKATAPAVLIGQFAATEWGARGLRGLSIRIPLTLIDRGDGTERLAAMAARVDAAMDGLPDMAGDWRVGTVRFDRSRTLRGSDGRWSMMTDYLARLSRVV